MPIPALPAGTTPRALLAFQLAVPNGGVGCSVRVTSSLDNKEVLGRLVGYVEQLEDKGRLFLGGNGPTRADTSIPEDCGQAAPPCCIPNRYQNGMSTQIAVRLPNELVAYVDRAVAEGRVRSRAELVARLIERDARRQRAEEDLTVLAGKG